jgi:hypothetical protein
MSAHSAELAARNIAAEAVVADFASAGNMFITGDQPEPQWQDWAWRLAGELRSLIGQLDAETLAGACADPSGYASLARADLLIAFTRSAAP